MLQYAEQKAPKDISKHYTPPEVAAFLRSLVPVKRGEIVIDPASGKNPFGADKTCDIENGCDFLSTPFEYDWAITNPPYHLLWGRKGGGYLDKCSKEAKKGFAFLVNINGINTLTPRRLQILKERKFYMRRLHVLNIKRWHGRYFFYVFTKEPGEIEYSWSIKTWDSSS